MDLGKTPAQWRRERSLLFLQPQPEPAWQAPLPALDILFLLFPALPSLCCLFFSFLPFLLTFFSAVLPKNFKVKMVTKTSVLLSWEFPENYNSPTPYKASAGVFSRICPSSAGLGFPCKPKGWGGRGWSSTSLAEGPTSSLPQIQYNGLHVDVDGRTTKKLITHLRPRTFYNFVLMNQGNSMGGLQQNVAAWTAADLLSKKPEVTHKPDADGNVVVILPDVKSSVPVQ